MLFMCWRKLLMKIFFMMVETSVYRIAVGRARHRELMTRSHRDPCFTCFWNKDLTWKFCHATPLGRYKIGTSACLRLKPDQAEPKRGCRYMIAPDLESGCLKCICRSRRGSAWSSAHSSKVSTSVPGAGHWKCYRRSLWWIRPIRDHTHTPQHTGRYSMCRATGGRHHRQRG